MLTTISDTQMPLIAFSNSLTTNVANLIKFEQIPQVKHSYWHSLALKHVKWVTFHFQWKWAGKYNLSITGVNHYLPDLLDIKCYLAFHQLLPLGTVYN